MDVKYFPLAEKLIPYVTIFACVIMVCFAIMHCYTLYKGGEKAGVSVGKFYNNLLSRNGLKLIAIVLIVASIVTLNLFNRYSEGPTGTILSVVLGYLFGHQSGSENKDVKPKENKPGKDSKLIATPAEEQSVVELTSTDPETPSSSG